MYLLGDEGSVFLHTYIFVDVHVWLLGGYSMRIEVEDNWHLGDMFGSSLFCNHIYIKSPACIRNILYCGIRGGFRYAPPRRTEIYPWIKFASDTTFRGL
jgi:hypothetical protein